MRILAVGSRVPAWVDAACAEYVKRLGAFARTELLEIAAANRPARGGDGRAMATEAERLLAALKPSECAVALDERGRAFTTRELAGWLEGRRREGQDLAFLIGGADGFAPAVRERADFTLSLSKLTLPHALARVVLLEQLYRAHTVLAHHPYHRD